MTRILRQHGKAASMKMEKEKILLTLTQEQEQGCRRRKLPKQWVSGTSSACAAAAAAQLHNCTTAQLHNCLLLKENTHPSFSEPANPCFSESEQAKVLTRVTFIQLYRVKLNPSLKKIKKGWNKDKDPPPYTLYIFPKFSAPKH